MLTDGGFGNGQFLFYMSEIALAALREKLHDGYPRGMPERFGELRQLLLFEGIIQHMIIVFVYRFLKIVRKGTNNNWNTQIISQKKCYFVYEYVIQSSAWRQFIFIDVSTI